MGCVRGEVPRSLWTVPAAGRQSTPHDRSPRERRPLHSPAHWTAGLAPQRYRAVAIGRPALLGDARGAREGTSGSPLGSPDRGGLLTRPCTNAPLLLSPRLAPGAGLRAGRR